MNQLMDVINGFEEGRRRYEELTASSRYEAFGPKEIYFGGGENRIAQGDNLKYMEFLLKKRNMRGKIQLIYADPPFFSNGKYQASVRLESEKLGSSPLIKLGAYDDRWEQGLQEYISMLTVRLFMMKELLADTGCLWMHLDWHASHYMKVILDMIFGEDNFINEIIWTYKSGGANKRSFAKKHDTLLFYSKGKNYTFNPQLEKSYNRELKPYRFQGVEEFKDDTGWYTMVNMKDVWSIDMVGRTSGERTGYATQKPEKLLERIVKACSREGDVCADFFAGSGTLGAVCSRLGRSWIMCDEGHIASAAQIYRLAKSGNSFTVERTGETEPDDRQQGFLRICCSHRDLVEEYLSEDSACTVKFLAVDHKWDGSIYRVDEIVDRQIGDASFEPGENAGILAYDIFGRRFVYDGKTERKADK